MLSELIPEKVRKLIIAQPLIWVAGFATSLSLFVDDSRRRAELAAYVLPKGMEVSLRHVACYPASGADNCASSLSQSMWSIARQRSWVPFVPGGDLLLTSAGMSMVMVSLACTGSEFRSGAHSFFRTQGTYAQNPEHLSGLVRRIIYQVSSLHLFRLCEPAIDSRSARSLLDVIKGHIRMCILRQNTYACLEGVVARVRDGSRKCISKRVRSSLIAPCCAR